MMNRRQDPSMLYKSPVVMMENLFLKLHYENLIIGWWHENLRPGTIAALFISKAFHFLIGKAASSISIYSFPHSR